jgi:hypothetical protein
MSTQTRGRATGLAAIEATLSSEGMKAISAETWQNQRDEAARRSAAVDRLFPPYERTRPRDPDEAEALRRRGVPERLIGPSR